MEEIVAFIKMESTIKGFIFADASVNDWADPYGKNFRQVKLLSSTERSISCIQQKVKHITKAEL